MDQYAQTTDLVELRDELAIQQTILASLLDNPNRDAINQTEVHNAQQAISALCRQIKTVESKDPTKKTASSTALMNRHNRFSTPASASTSSASGAGFNRFKRPAPSGFDDDDSNGYPSKSYKTTPSPAQTGITTPSFNDDFSTANDDAFIDLTGDDGDFQNIINNQRALFARLEQQREDEKMAKHLSQQWQSSSPAPGPSARPAGPSAFDRILDRPSQSQTQRPDHRSGLPSGLASFNGNARPDPSAIVPKNPSMPGSYISDDDDDDDDALLELSFHEDDPSLFFPSFSNGARNPSSNASLQWNSHVSAPGPSVKPEPLSRFPTHVHNVPAAELARRAALARQQAYHSFGGPSSSNANGYGPPNHLPNPFDDHSTMASSVYRPGMLTSGSYQPLGMTRVYNSVFPPRPPAGIFPGNNLTNVIGKTNGIDWANGLDAFGNPLNDRLMSYYDDLQDDPRKTQEEIRDLLANIRPDEEIPKEDRMGTPEALRYPLYDHQKLALKWMTDSEEGKNKGGILADDMGLGKTISTIALVVSRQATDRVKTNLIVGPVALLKQWELELKKKLKSGHQMSTLLLHGKNATYEELRRFDVVLTSYGKLGHEEKRYQRWLEHHPGADPSADIGLAKSCPLVHPKSKFYRVILDEAQCIKNVNTFQAKGAAHLQSTYRWCLTGTPMMNGIHELYSLIRFLKIAPYHNQKEFNKRFGSLSAKSARSRAAGDLTRTRAMDALRVLLKAIMLRRMKTSKLDGKPLLSLPPKTEEVVHVVLNDDEMDFYKTLEARTKITFNKYLRAGTVGKNYSNVLVLLLRLRQACCHPHLNLDVEYVGSSEVNQADMANLAKTLAPDVVNRLKAANEEGFNCPICLDAVIDPTIVLPCGHNSCGECFSTLVAGAAENNIRSGEEGNNIKCPECRGPINPKQVINLTAFKAVHMPEAKTSDEAAEAEAADEASDDNDSDLSDSESDKDGDESGDDVDRNGNLKGFIVKDDEAEESAGEQKNEDENDDGLFVPQRSASSGKENKDKSKSRSKSGKSRGKGKEKQKKEEVKPHMLKTLRLEAKKNKAQYKRYMKYLKKNWMPSAKVDKCCDILQGIQESGDKTIVFSQFTFLLDLLEIPIKYDLGINYCRYDGGMTRQQRDAATMDFQDPNSSTKVMLVSLKAGNAGLNLTAANHVIIMDPFWNFFVESQAVDRAHRIGQQKPVQVHRLLTQETVEDRIIEIQEQKRKFIDAALDEGESKNLGRLSLQDLQFLFNGRD